jgi:hypothetical protein
MDFNCSDISNTVVTPQQRKQHHPASRTSLDSQALRDSPSLLHTCRPGGHCWLPLRSAGCCSTRHMCILHTCAQQRPPTSPNCLCNSGAVLRPQCCGLQGGKDCTSLVQRSCCCRQHNLLSSRGAAASSPQVATSHLPRADVTVHGSPSMFHTPQALAHSSAEHHMWCTGRLAVIVTVVLCSQALELTQRHGIQPPHSHRDWLHQGAAWRSVALSHVSAQHPSHTPTHPRL